MCKELKEFQNCLFINSTKAGGGYKVLHNRFTNKIVGAHCFGMLVNKRHLSRTQNNHFVFFDSNPYLYNENFLKWLRKIKNSTISVIFVNTMATRNMRDVEYFKRNCDFIYTIDRKDAEDYGFIFWEGIHSKIEHQLQNGEKGIAYAGVAKNRGIQILQVYEALQKLNYNCNFTVVGLENAPAGINTERIPYEQVLQEELKANCILEICVGEQNALTLRAIEAVLYNKYLLTNNKNIVKCRYYDARKMRILDMDRSLEEQLKDIPSEIEPYDYKGEYSPIALLIDIENRNRIKGDEN